MSNTGLHAAALVLTLVSGPPAFAQQQSNVPSNMPGHNMDSHNMGGMDMQTMMSNCAQMRRQMQPGARMTAEMHSMMQQCDQMDQQMGGTSAGDNAPRTRTR